MTRGPQTPGLDAESTSRRPVRPPSQLATTGLEIFFFLADRAPWILRSMRAPCVWLAVLACKPLRLATRANAKRIFAMDISPARQRQFTRDVVANFYDFVLDAARSASLSRDELVRQIDRVVGEPAYLTARQAKRGAVLVTAHMGAFEIGLAALRTVEENVHVVFKRDAFARFERLRAQARSRLGVHEAPIDEGWPALVRLRDALMADEVVVMQGDRAMAGQKSLVTPFLGGHLRVPVGPVKLASMTGSPIVPVFVVRSGARHFEVHLGEPVWVQAPDAIEPAVATVVREIESFVKRHPQQWLVLDRAFVEDQQRVG
jgi:KDO2-lipid IV(A) lauroyltransferase